MQVAWVAFRSPHVTGTRPRSRPARCGAYRKAASMEARDHVTFAETPEPMTSRDLDHRYVVPPYLRVVTEQTVPGTDQRVALWDFRVAQPNASHVPGPVMHSLEHFLGTYVRTHHPTIMNVAPMGCMTGLYVWTVGEWNFDDLADVITAGLRSIRDADEVPLANIVQCGWAEHHSLEGVKEFAERLLADRDQWRDPGPDAHEVSAADLRELSAG